PAPAAPEPPRKRVVTRPRRARRSVAAAPRAPPGWKNLPMPRPPGSRARRWSMGSAPRSGKALAFVAGRRPTMQRLLLLFALAILAEGERLGCAGALRALGGVGAMS